MIILTGSIIMLVVSIFVIYPITKYTTIGNNDYIMSKMIELFKNERYQTNMRKLSYTKIFVCRPCHTFWITVFMCIILAMFLIFPTQLIIPQSFVTFFIILLIEKNKT